MQCTSKAVPSNPHQRQRGARVPGTELTRWPPADRSAGRRRSQRRSPAEDHRERLQLTMDRVEDETQRLERRRTEQRRVAGLTEDHGCRAATGSIDEERIATFTLDRRAVRQTELLAPMGCDPETLENLAWHERVDRTGIDEEFDARPGRRLRRVRDVERERRQSHAARRYARCYTASTYTRTYDADRRVSCASQQCGTQSISSSSRYAFGCAVASAHATATSIAASVVCSVRKAAIFRYANAGATKRTSQPAASSPSAAANDRLTIQALAAFAIGTKSRRCVIVSTRIPIAKRWKCAISSMP